MDTLIFRKYPISTHQVTFSSNIFHFTSRLIWPKINVNKDFLLSILSPPTFLISIIFGNVTILVKNVQKIIYRIMKLKRRDLMFSKLTLRNVFKYTILQKGASLNYNKSEKLLWIETSCQIKVRSHVRYFEHLKFHLFDENIWNIILVLVKHKNTDDICCQIESLKIT